jgi:protein-disulfide isomerase
MTRSLFACMTAALTLALAGSAQNAGPAKKSALDKATLEAYVRHLYVMDSRINVQISDPKPSEVPGFLEEIVHATAGPQSQDFKFLISKDGSKILQASVFDVNQNPFKPDLDKLKTQGSPAIGTSGAPVVLVEFSDFECPYCKQQAEMLRKNLLSAYPTQVRMYFKTFPLESLHPWAKAAAIASRCVYKQNADAFWAYHDWIFERQSDITADNLKDKVMEWAKAAKGVDALQLGECMDTKATDDQVNADIAEGHALEVNATPTLFINGRRIAQTIDWPNLKSIIDYEIEYQKTAKNAGDDCGCELKLKLPGMPAGNQPAAVVKKQ